MQKTRISQVLASFKCRVLITTKPSSGILVDKICAQILHVQLIVFLCIKSEPLLKLMSSVWRERATQCPWEPVWRQLLSGELNNSFYKLEPSPYFIICHVCVRIRILFPRAAKTNWQILRGLKQQKFIC